MISSRLSHQLVAVQRETVTLVYALTYILLRFVMRKKMSIYKGNKPMMNCENGKDIIKSM